MSSLHIDVNFLLDERMRQPMNHTAFSDHSETDIFIFIMLQGIKFDKLTKLLFAHRAVDLEVKIY